MHLASLRLVGGFLLEARVYSEFRPESVELRLTATKGVRVGIALGSWTAEGGLDDAAWVLVEALSCRLALVAGALLPVEAPLAAPVVAPENTKASFAAVAAYADAFRALLVAGQAVAATRPAGAEPTHEVLENVRESVLVGLSSDALAAVSYVGPVERDEHGRTDRQAQGDIEGYVSELLCRDYVAERDLAHYNAALNARDAIRAVLDGAGATAAAELDWHQCDAFGLHTAQVRLPGRLLVTARVSADETDSVSLTLKAYCPERAGFIVLATGGWHALGGLDADAECMVAGDVAARLAARQAADRDAAVTRVMAGAW